MSINYYEATAATADFREKSRTNKANESVFPRLTENLTVDVCVVGGGMAGLATAQELVYRGYDVAVLEKEQVGFGASGRNGGQAIIDVGCGYETLVNLIGREKAGKIFQTTKEGIHLIRENIKKYKINCDLIDGTLTVSQKPRQDAELKKYQSLYSSLGYEVELWDKVKTQSVVATDLYTGAIYAPEGLHLHPLNYTIGLAKNLSKEGVHIYENSPVIKYTETKTGVRISTETVTVEAKNLVLCANVYNKLSSSLRSKIMPVGTYIAATKPLGEEFANTLISNRAAVCDMNFVLDYFRIDSSTRLLFGGRVSYTKAQPANLKHSLFKRMVRVYPQFKKYTPEEIFEYAWGGHVDITLNRAPHFGSLSKKVFFLQGFSGHGVALTNVAGRIMGEAIAGERERLSWYEEIPHRRFFGGQWFRAPLLALGMLYFRAKDYF